MFEFAVHNLESQGRLWDISRHLWCRLCPFLVWNLKHLGAASFCRAQHLQIARAKCTILSRMCPALVLVTTVLEHKLGTSATSWAPTQLVSEGSSPQTKPKNKASGGNRKATSLVLLIFCTANSNTTTKGEATCEFVTRTGVLHEGHRRAERVGTTLEPPSGTLMIFL